MPKTSLTSRRQRSVLATPMKDLTTEPTERTSSALQIVNTSESGVMKSFRATVPDLAVYTLQFVYTGWPKKVSHHQLKKIALKIANEIRFFHKIKV